MIYGQHVTEEFHKPGSESDKIWKHRGWNQDKDLQGKVSICGSEEHLEDENDQQENKDTHFQEQRTKRTTIMLQSLGKWPKEYATCWKYSKTSASEEFCTSFGQTR